MKDLSNIKKILQDNLSIHVATNSSWRFFFKNKNNKTKIQHLMLFSADERLIHYMKFTYMKHCIKVGNVAPLLIENKKDILDGCKGHIYKQLNYSTEIEAIPEEEINEAIFTFLENNKNFEDYRLYLICSYTKYLQYDTGKELRIYS